ncbi:MAG: HlyD family efflux transporter periplasmic adaptor subunit [Bacteroidota bacterium]
MLNISPSRINDDIPIADYHSLSEVESRHSGRVLTRIIWTIFVIALGIMFLPWTQNIRARGNMTTLRPDQRPQTIHSIIAGRIENWYVREGDFVNKGDTILFISETKDEYFDPNVINNNDQQLKAKEMSVISYKQKVQAMEQQIAALKEGRRLKLQQAENKLQQSLLKVTSDSIDYQAASTNFDIAQEQYKRMQGLYDAGLKSLTDLENRKLKAREAQAKVISAQNKLLTSQNMVLNARVEITSIRAEYDKDIAKSESDKFTALSSQFDAEATVTKMKNKIKNLSVRFGYHYITSPQTGYVTKAIQSGIGETIKEGAEIVSIMPAKYDLAVELYVMPMDLPLLEKGQHVRLQFDGWPAIIFSGWPNSSFGTYGGEIFAIDNFVSDNGKYRVLVAQDPDDAPWPEALRVGAGANSMMLLKDVRIWYELWRQINGFPADYYKPLQEEGAKEDKDKEKK